MGRANLTSNMIAALTASLVRPVHFCILVFNDGPVYLCDLPYNISWNGHTWLGNGTLEGVDQVQETTDSKAGSYNVILSGCDQAMISEVLGQSNQQNQVTVWLGCLDSSNALISSPITLFSCFYDFAVLTADGNSAKITITCSSQIANLKKVRERRYTSESQKALFPGDTGFDYVPATVQWTGFWGKSRPPRITKKPSTRGT